MVQVAFQHGWEKSSYSISRLPRLRPVQNPWPSTVINIGLVSKVGHPLSRLLCVLVGIRGKGPWWGVGGSSGGCFRVRQSSGPSRREETFPPRPPPKVGGSPAPGVTKWAPCSSLICGGETNLLSLDLRRNWLSSPGALVQRTEKQLSGWCSPKLEKKIVHYRVYIYCVLFDVSFLPFFFFLKPQTFQNHTAGVRRVSNWKHNHCIVLNEQRRWVLYLQLLSR